VSYGSPPPPPGNQPPYGGNPYGQQPPYGGGAPFGGPTSGDPGTLDLPYYGIGFVAAVQRAFKKYARFDGRASKSEFWWFQLGYLLLVFVAYIPAIIGIAADVPALALIGVVLVIALLLASIVPAIAVSARRLHDANLSGWLYLISLIPCGSIVLIVLWCLPSKPEGARYDRVGGGQNFGGGYGNPYGQ